MKLDALFRIKMDGFSIFLLILGLLVVITLFMNYRKYAKIESFVNFQNQPAAGTLVYIPQFSTDPTHKVLSLYDNLYFDSANGTLIEVFASSCNSNCDNTGEHITDITVAARDGREITAIPTVLDKSGKVTPYSTPHSLLMVIQPQYNQFMYTTSCSRTNLYQILYVSWYTDTYIHVIDLSMSKTAGTNLRTFHLNSSGLLDSQTSYSVTTLQTYLTSGSSINTNTSTSISTITNKNYMNGNVQLSQLGTDSNGNVILYDIHNGNIVVNVGEILHIYNRNGSIIQNANPNTTWNSLTITNTFTVNDIAGVSIIITAYQDDTIISVLVPLVNTYKLLSTFRFNKTGFVNSMQNDTEHNPALQTPASTTSANTTIPNLGITNNVTNLTNSPSNTSSVCGDDLSCKWYWYFNTIAQKNSNGNTYFSDDYFLKTEVVPPVCPQCPLCPASGICSNCGGNGGCGTVVTTTPEPTTITTPKVPGNTTLPDGAVTDSSGNIYIPYTDASGNTKYILYSTLPTLPHTSAPTCMAATTSTASTSNEITSNEITSSGTMNGTYMDSNGNLVTSANPNTVVGGLTTTALGAEQLGTTGLNTVGGFANNIVNTAGNAVDSVVGTAGNLANTVVGTAGNAVGSVVNLAGETVGTAADLVKGAGSGLMNMGNNQGYYNNMNGTGTAGTVGTVGMAGTGTGGYGQNGNSVGGYAAGNYRPGYTPIDNYSYYGALQSKGGNYMPVTADFSAFRR
jgi:hypothetical protein